MSSADKALRENSGKPSSEKAERLGLEAHIRLPEPKTLRQDDQEFRASLGYMKTCLNKNKVLTRPQSV